MIEYNQNNKQRIQTLRGTFKYPAEEKLDLDELLHWPFSQSTSPITSPILLSPNTSTTREMSIPVLKEGILKSKNKYWCCLQENIPVLAYYKKKEVRNQFFPAIFLIF